MRSPTGAPALDAYLRDSFELVQYVADNMGAIKAVADHLTPVEDLVTFQATIEALYAKLALLVQASEKILQATPAGLDMLTALDAAAQRQLLGLGTVALMNADGLVDPAAFAALSAWVQQLQLDMDDIANGIGIGGDWATTGDLTTLSNALNLQITSLSGDIQAEADLRQALSLRTTQVEDGLVLQAQATTDLEIRSTNLEALVETQGTASQELSVQVTDLENRQQTTSLATTVLTGRITDAEEGLVAEAAARQQLATDLVLTQESLTATASDVTTLQASITGTGNLLANAGFAFDTRDWELYSRGVGWQDAVLQNDLDAARTPPAIHALGLTAAGTPTGSAGIRSTKIPVSAQTRYFLSGYPAAEGCTVRMEYRLYDTAGNQVGLDVAGLATNVSPAINLIDWQRQSKAFTTPLDAVLLEVQVWVTDCTAAAPKAWLLRPQLEQATGDQSEPSPWSLGSGGLEEAISTAVDALTVRVELTEEGLVSTANQLTSLTTQVGDNTAAVSLETDLRTSSDESLATQISLVAAGSGEQFDSAKIWYFDSDLEAWTGNGAPTIVDGWLRPADHATDPFLVSPAGLALNGGSYRFLKLRLKQTGNPGWSGQLRWRLAGDAAGTWRGPMVVPAPVMGTDGTTVLSYSDIPWWPGTVDQVRLDLSLAQSATDYWLVDWVALGRPTPGAGVALVQVETAARITEDAALSSRIDTVKATADNAATSAQLTTEQTARADADTALGTRIDSVTATANNAATKASLTAEQTARADADAANASATTVVQANLDALQIGGRNLVDYDPTGEVDSTGTVSGKAFNIGSGTGTMKQFSMSRPLKPNTKYSISFVAWSAGGGTFNVDLYPDTLPQTLVTLVANTPKRFVWEGISSTSADMASAVLRLFGANTTNSGTTYVGDVKVEEGTRATAWTPNPDDVDGKIATNAAAITAEQTARANADSANAISITNLTARVAATEAPGQNLMVNPTGGSGFTFPASYGFSWIGGAQQQMETRTELFSNAGPMFACSFFGTGPVDQGFSVTIDQAASNFTISADMDARKVATGQMIVQLRFLNSTGGEILASNRPAIIATNGQAMKRYSSSGTAPAGTAKVTVIPRFTGTLSENSAVGWRNIKLEVGSKATPYSNDATVNSTATVTQELTAGATINGGAYAAATVMVDANGRVGGTRLASDGSASSFRVRVDEFSIESPTGTGARTGFADSVWTIYDANNKLRMKWGIF